LSSEARSAATSWHSAEAGLAAGVEAAGAEAAGVEAAGDDGAAEVELPGALATPDEVLLDPQATVTSPAANATAQTFQADRTNVIRLMSASLASRGPRDLIPGGLTPGHRHDQAPANPL
jgi:hypothetical protein